MNGFNERKSIDALYHKNGNLNDETDTKSPQGPEEVRILITAIINVLW